MEELIKEFGGLELDELEDKMDSEETEFQFKTGVEQEVLCTGRGDLTRPSSEAMKHSIVEDKHPLDVSLQTVQVQGDDVGKLNDLKNKHPGLRSRNPGTSSKGLNNKLLPLNIPKAVRLHYGDDIMEFIPIHVEHDASNQAKAASKAAASMDSENNNEEIQRVVELENDATSNQQEVGNLSTLAENSAVNSKENFPVLFPDEKLISTLTLENVAERLARAGDSPESAFNTSEDKKQCFKETSTPEKSQMDEVLRGRGEYEHFKGNVETSVGPKTANEQTIIWNWFDEQTTQLETQMLHHHQDHHQLEEDEQDSEDEEPTPRRNNCSQQ